jgi:hypothetical protein
VTQWNLLGDTPSDRNLNEERLKRDSFFAPSVEVTSEET